MDKPIVRKYGSRAILMEWEALISPKINDEVIATAAFLNKHHSESILETVASYQSLVIFIKESANLERHIDICQNITVSISQENKRQPTWNIPVCYDLSFGLDLELISKAQKLPIETIIRLHSEPNYRIYGIGFLPGFLYLGGLNKKIYTPRKRTINQSVSKGSVAIGGEQTGIYPQDSPGGWNVIGKTPIELFNPNEAIPTPFSEGDLVRFHSISRSEYDHIQQEIVQGTYQVTTILYD